MATPLSLKSTIQDIERRFDNDVERFSDLAKGQVATIDAPLAMDLITEAAIASTRRRESFRGVVNLLPVSPDSLVKTSDVYFP